MEQNQSSKSGIVKAIGAVVVLGLAGLGIWKLNSTTSEQTPTTSDNPSTTPLAKKKYFDGTYTKSGNYTSPAGQEEVDITVTIKDDAVTAATFTGKATNPGSKKMQGLFGEGFTTEVVGKPVDEVALTVVNGSSLTPKGFMEALNKIKVEATSRASS